MKLKFNELRKASMGVLYLVAVYEKIQIFLLKFISNSKISIFLIQYQNDKHNNPVNYIQTGREQEKQQAAMFKLHITFRTTLLEE